MAFNNVYLILPPSCAAIKPYLGKILQKQHMQPTTDYMQFLKTLAEKIQFEADCATSWVSDNKLVCSGGKTKLLIVTTTAMRLTRLAGRKLHINVCGDLVEESECEKILGILANNKLSWWHHLYGDTSDPKKPQPGLIPQLSKRVGLLSRLSRLVPVY